MTTIKVRAHTRKGKKIKAHTRNVGKKTSIRKSTGASKINGRTAYKRNALRKATRKQKDLHSGWE